MSEIDLNEVFEETIDDATVITVPLDTTLQNAGEAAEAKAVGEALALKADAASVNAIQVNGQAADNQGLILIDGTNIPLTDAPGAPTIAQAVNSSQARTADGIQMSDDDETTVAEKIGELETELEGGVRSVNGELPDGNGNVEINTVPYAINLQSENNQTNTGEFIARSTGGSASVDSGDASLVRILGNSVHEGFVPEVLEWNVNTASSDSDLQADLDRDTFLSQVAAGGTYTFTYTSSWNIDPATYGITVSGTPASGDQIVVEYSPEVRGTITVSNPQTFVATGWNLYRSADGYAKVVKYSDTYGFRAEGDFTALQYSETLNGARSSITVSNGNFTIPGDGYVWVTGGNGSTTRIYMTWSDWTEQANGGTFQAYTQKAIDFSAVMTAQFPYGLMKAGNTRDEINISTGTAISRVERMEYSAENLAAAIQSGREYEYDQNYIYLALASEETNDISVNGNFAADDHGIEFFTETTVPVSVEILYGENLANKLARDVVTISGHLANNLTTAAAGMKALDAFQGGVLKGVFTVHSNTADKKSYTWRYPSGLMITMIIKTVTAAITSTSGAIYYAAVEGETFPIAYSEVPIVIPNTIASGLNAWIWSGGVPTKTKTGKFYLARGAAKTAQVGIQILAIGYKAP